MKLHLTSAARSLVKEEKVASYIYGGLILTHITYFIVAFGLVAFNPMYIEWLNIFVQTLVGLYLVYRFNPWQYTEYLPTMTDARIIFSCAMLILSNLAITKIVQKWVINTTGMNKIIKLQ